LSAATLLRRPRARAPANSEGMGEEEAFAAILRSSNSSMDVGSENYPHASIHVFDEVRLAIFGLDDSGAICQGQRAVIRSEDCHR
jgi:hypothetical protein